MKVTFESKVQQHGGSRLVSIPKTIRDVFGIDKGDVVLWEYDTDLKIITLKKQE
ncbi:AbrB/MazE/SpoVT family DNA-binding domain-containing protein [Methanobrevibacter smithii]|jgi:spoVT / abrB like domain|uniref:AbrB/MazE/SpoVT family DNA-binding domain-containing protein n=1 Tax=Methanobrevibacter smithii TaxID=2173 RepID=UPI002052D07C|nr:MAG TPA: AbrB family transcriptional regulator-like protein [Caudoviricetes sp.]DAI44058.1 MAG TPA: AbrB family transcriptional regulator-like protein [Caudoviricetes sp.]